METFHTGLETACYAAEKEREGMPPSFKEHGYAHPMPRANLILVREHLQNALHSIAKGLNSETLRHVTMAIKELER